MSGESRGAAAGADAPRPDALRRVVALDGPAGSGKSTVAALTAQALGWRFVDTGATYRAATLAVLRAGVDPANAALVAEAVARARIELGTDPGGRAGIRLDGEDVSAEIRGPAVTAHVSAVAAVPAVRALMIGLQREAIGADGAVVEGRDIATVVAPQAAVKVYLDARPEVRASRRAEQQPSAAVSAEQVQAALQHRDALDSRTNRLEPSEGAVHLDTSDLTLAEVVATVVRLAERAGITQRPLAGGSGQAEPAHREAGDAHPGERESEHRSAADPAGPRGTTRWVRATGQRREWLIRLARPFGRVLFQAAFRVKVVGREHVPRSGPAILAGNHTGFLDGPLAFALAPRTATFLAKSELFVGPLARALGWLGQLPVHRGRADRAALRGALAVLGQGGVVGVFPEGTRGSGTLQQVSDGVAYLALRSGAPLVPLAVLGTSEAMPKGARLPRWRAPVSLVFGPPFTVDVEGDPRARRTVRAAAEQIRLALVAHLQAATEDHRVRVAVGQAPGPREPRDDLADGGADR